MATEGFKIASSRGGHAVGGETHRFYRLSIAADDASILIPTNAHWASVLDNAEALDYEIHTAARVVTGNTGRARAIAASHDGPMRPVSPGEYINISHSDGATNIGAVTICLEGSNLPDSLTVTDPA